jgi:SH3-like domain-containing protein
MLGRRRTTHTRSTAGPCSAAGLCALLLGAMLTFVPGGEAAAETAWVRGGIRLNLRTDAGTAYRIIAGVATGDEVAVVDRVEGWTQVRIADGKTGWIPEGYLQPEPPPTVRLAQLEDEVTSLRAKLETSDATAADLKTTNDTLGSRDGGQRADIDRLKVENTELRANKRWPEWITGASVLAVGMLLGALLHRNATRRPSSRIRL